MVVLLRTLTVALLVTACTNREPGAPVSQIADDPVPAVAADPTATGSAWQWRAEHGDVEGSSHTVVGLLGQRGDEHCTADGEQQWANVHPAVGRVVLRGPADDAVEPLMDQPVLALGRPIDDPQMPAPRASGSSCVPMQMRSDWRVTPRGIVRDRPPAPSVQQLEATAVRRLHELTVRPDGDHLLVTFTNPFGVELHDVELRVYYEGCRGKPGSHAQVEAVGVLGVGAQASARMPRVEPDESRAFSVHLSGRGPDVVIDLDVPLTSYGIDVKCSRR